MNWIYLDHAASTPMEPEGVEVFRQSLSEDYCNSSAAHILGREQSEKNERIRELLHEKLQAPLKDYEIVFTSSATESNNWVIQQVPLLKRAQSKGPCTIANSESYHPSLVKPVQHILSEDFESFEIPLKEGRVDEAALLSDLPPNCALLNLLWVNNSSGVVTDVKPLAEKIKKKFPAVWIHVDGVQGFAKFPLSLKDSAIDSLTINGHKMGGPKGVAALVFRKDSLLPWILGGEHENSFRASTLNTSAILAWGKAISAVYEQMNERLEKVSELRDFFKEELSRICPEVEFPFCFNEDRINSPYIFSVVFPGISSDILLRHLERKGVLLSTSSACSSRGSKKVTQVYAAMGLAQEKHSQIVRVSLNHLLDKNSLKKL